MLRRLAALVVTVGCACSAGGLDPDPGSGGDDDEIEIGPDGGQLDAGPEPAVACELPALTAGVSTLGGCGVSGAADGPRGTATFANPVNVIVVGDELVVADFDNDKLRAIDADGEVRTIVDQPGFQRPFGLAVDADGQLYVQTDDNDAGLHSGDTGTIWRVDLDGGAAIVVARDLGRPRGLLALPDGRLVLSDYVHQDVRLLDPDTGAVTPLAGLRDMPGQLDATGAAARFTMPYGLARLPDGRVAVAEFGTGAIRAVALDGVVTTLVAAGTLGHPQALAVDPAGTLYVTDTDGYVVRALRDGALTTVVGSGAAGWLDSGELLAAELHGLEGVAVSEDGATMWLADGTRGEEVPFRRVRVVNLP